MKPKVKVVIGANYGDEGKGLVSAELAKKAADHGHKVLTVLYNGGAQRGHTANGIVHHCTAAGAEWGSDTYYGPRFMLDPIALWLSEQRVFVDSMCRVVLPHDVIAGRGWEMSRGLDRHGSCGMGIFAACKRNANPSTRLLAYDAFHEPILFLEKRLAKYSELKGEPLDEVYNTNNFLEAIRWMRRTCLCMSLKEIKTAYDTVIFEGGQGLLLDQGNAGGFPHLTPSNTGARNTLGLIKELNDGKDGYADLYYVSRTYMTRHGAGRLMDECSKEDINPDIVDETNQPNQWQGSLRFGYLHPDEMVRRIKNDAKRFDGIGVKTINLVFTQANYTEGKLAVGEGKRIDIPKFDGVDKIWVSDNREEMRSWL